MRSWIALLGIGLMGCGEPPSDDPRPRNPGGSETEAPWLRTLDIRTTTGNDGSVLLDFTVEEGEQDMLLTLSPVDDPSAVVYFDEVFDPDGTLVFDGDAQWYTPYSLSYAYWPDVSATLNWPILGEHQLRPGRWTLRITTLDKQSWRSVGDVAVRMDGQLSQDPSFDRGELSVRVVYTGGVDADPVVTEAVEGAIERWGEIYAAIDVDTTFETVVYPGQESFEPPSYGSYDLYEALMADNEVGTLNLVVVPEFSGQGGEWTLGISGGIPGALAPTGLSAVGVNVGAHWGNDMRFSEEELRIFAETMAHEVGHYLGLFHPVEDGWNAWDSLGDTVDCKSRNECEGQLGSNLMFPYTVCTAGSCVAQESLTPGQKSVTHRYVGVY